MESWVIRGLRGWKWAGLSLPTVIFGLIVIADVAIALVTNWKTYGVVRLLLGFLLLISLCIGPILQIRSENAGKRVRLDQSLCFSYVLMMLAIQVFVR